LETCGLYVAGRGSAPNSAGHVELDASIMDGKSREAGAVAALCDFVSPVQVARGVMEKTPHVMLAGTGALEFARAQGFAEVPDPTDYYTLPVGVTRDDIEDGAHGTVGAVALDASGGLAAATSTGGTFGKLHGRIGDTPLIGPGTWADDNIAISFTGTGEHIIRAGGATAIAFRYRSGVALSDAIGETLKEIKRLGGDAGVIAVTRSGEIAMPYNSQGMKRASVSTNSTLTVATFD
jgi:isoaspartyl peptidase/L-asparaginase-like protein (Ntn-hydrolase superfamily)